MSNIGEIAQWVDGVYQLETTDSVQGGQNGLANLQAKQLADRTAFLLKKGVNYPKNSRFGKVNLNNSYNNTTISEDSEAIIVNEQDITIPLTIYLPTPTAGKRIEIIKFLDGNVSVVFKYGATTLYTYNNSSDKWCVFAANGTTWNIYNIKKTCNTPNETIDLAIDKNYNRFKLDLVSLNGSSLFINLPFFDGIKDGDTIVIEMSSVNSGTVSVNFNDANFSLFLTKNITTGYNKTLTFICICGLRWILIGEL